MDFSSPICFALHFLGIVSSHPIDFESEVNGTEVKSCSLLQTQRARTYQSDLNSRLWFHASSLEAKSLHKGCGSSVDYEDSKRKPSFVMLGTQKSGTTSIEEMLAEFGCVGLDANGGQEVHFFDSGKFAHGRIPSALLNDYLVRPWRKCDSRNLRFEKSPSYYMQAWTPLRMCEGLGGEQRLVLFLRDPIARAYSGFYQSQNEPGKNPPVPLTPEGFDTYARVEIAIVQSCGGLPSGDLQRDLAGRSKFSACCRSVARKFSFHVWSSCECELDNHQHCGAFGKKSGSHVRMGIYAPYVRNWLQYFHPANIYMYIVEESVFIDMERVAWELSCDISPVKPAICEGREGSMRLGRGRKANSSTKKKPPMLGKTFEMLKNFYSPFNHALKSLLGRDLPW